MEVSGQPQWHLKNNKNNPLGIYLEDLMGKFTAAAFSWKLNHLAGIGKKTRGRCVPPPLVLYTCGTIIIGDARAG